MARIRAGGAAQTPPGPRASLRALPEAVLRRLTSDAMLNMFGQSPQAEFVVYPGCCLALTGEPVADANYVIAGRGANDGGRFASACSMCISRGLPFLAIIFPEAESAVEHTAAELGLVHVVDFPFMVRDDLPIEPDGNTSVVVRRATGSGWVDPVARVGGSAFGMPEDVVRRVMPASFVAAPNLDVFLASIDDEVVGSVVLTHHGDTSGVWMMGTVSDRQGSGIGRRLLSTAMAQVREQGVARFYLGATPAGYRLYESLGFATRVVTKVWAWGESHQV
jgi:ribosomal protein S18 acetylase RimI-like enzyme